MPRLAAARKSRWVFLALLGCLFAQTASGGSYLESAHGSSVFGVNRSSIDPNFVTYATGNCSHCHEQHASIEGAEPNPSNGPAAHILFADSFNETATTNPYVETDNFCFYCHNNISGPLVVNRDYSATFGGGDIGVGPQSIMEAFNQLSYHNLYDVKAFLTSETAFSAWFSTLGNPCSGCHNPHMAKRNWDSAMPGFPLLSAISIPGVSGALWGESEVMSSYFSYEAPFAFDSTNREPAGIGDQNGANTPDYAGFCTSCHNQSMTIASTTLSRNVNNINWGNTGLNQDKHGQLTRDGSDHFREPYLTAAAVKTNFVLSCLDCHEAHGSGNIMLLRGRINGEDLEGAVVSTDTMSYACMRCHTDDLTAAAGTNEAGKWEFVHHLAVDAPYAQMTCVDCHGAGGGNTPIACGNCHGHGMTDSWAGANATGRQTF